MRLIGISMVRNEADVIEAFVRHNLGVLDGLVVIDHASLDSTAEILRQLQREGLALRMATDTSAGFFQAERMTSLARQVLAHERADFIFLLDADEFIKIESRERLEQALARLPAGAHGLAPWINYVPEAFVEPVTPAHLRWRVGLGARDPGKVIVGRSFLAHPGQYVISGNHLVDDSTTGRVPLHVRLRASDIALAHLPVRSRGQLEAKIIIGYAAHLATRPTNDRQAFHWRDLFEELREGRELSASRLREIACNYGRPRDAWRSVDAIELFDDPVRATFEMRYRSQSRPDALRLLMSFVETLLRQ